MTEAQTLYLASQALLLTLKIAAIPLTVILLVGLLTSILQAATQINEQTLSFLPKILALSGVLFFMGPWLLTNLLNFTKDLLVQISTVTKF